MSGPEDDATVVERAREDREDEKKVVDALRKDGTFEKFRKRVMEEVCAKDELKAYVAEAVTNSKTLGSRHAAHMSEKELVDALREEMEYSLMTQFAKHAWGAMCDESGGIGREMYEAVHEVRERVAREGEPPPPRE